MLDLLAVCPTFVLVKVAWALVCNVIVWMTDDLASIVVECAKAVWAALYEVVDSRRSVCTGFSTRGRRGICFCLGNAGEVGRPDRNA